MSLIERDEHLMRLDRLQSDCATGRGQVVLLEGPVACGKTDLLRAFAKRAEDSGGLYLNATCSYTESTLPFGVIGQLFHSIGLTLDVEGQVRRLLNSGTVESTLIGSDSDARIGELFYGLTLSLLNLAADTPILIGIDDVRHADSLSLQYLLYLVCRLKAARILLTFADDINQQSRHSDFRTELFRQPHFHHIRLGPLSQDGVTGLLAEHMDGATADLLAPHFFKISGGNPLLLHALIKDRDSSQGVRTGGYGLELLNCLHRGDFINLHVGRALAVLGENASPSEISQLVGAGVETVIRALDAMTAAGLLDKGHFRHRVARSTLLDELSRQDRSDLHRRAAGLLHDRGASARAVAHHLIEIDDMQDPWAVEVLLEAAEEALLRDEVQFSANCLKLAHQWCVREQDRAAIRARLARAEWQISPSIASRHLVPLAAAAREGLLDRRDSIVLIRQLLWHGRNDEAEEVLEQIRDSREEQHSEAAADLHDTELWLARSYPPFARTYRSPAKLPNQNILAKPEVDRWLHSTAKLADALARGRSHAAVDRAEHVLRDFYLGRNAPWSEESAMFALFVLICADRYESARGWCAKLLAETNTRQASTWKAMFAGIGAEIALRQGDFGVAVNSAQAAIKHMDAKSWGVAIGFPLGSLILAATRMGDHNEAAKYLNESIAEKTVHTRYGLHYLNARGHYYLAMNHFHAALADFLSCGNLMREWDLDVAALVPWRTSAAEVWLRLGDQDQARRLIYDQLRQLGTDGSRTRGLSLRLLSAISPIVHRPKILKEALDLLEKCGDRFEQARVLSDLSEAYHALGEKRRARMVFRRALHVAKMCEANLLYRELLSAGSNFGGTAAVPTNADGFASLTSSEERVASLAVVGYTNREIASKLYITPSTVEQHLTRVYRKLNVKSRKDLPVGLRTDIIGTASMQAAI